MSVTRTWIVAAALTLTGGCNKKSNTTEQNQPTGSGTAAPGAVGSQTNPNMPNPSGAAPGTPMGSATMQPGAADNPMLDGGVGDGGTGDGGAAKKQ